MQQVFIGIKRTGRTEHQDSIEIYQDGSVIETRFNGQKMESVDLKYADRADQKIKSLVRELERQGYVAPTEPTPGCPRCEGSFDAQKILSDFHTDLKTAHAAVRDRFVSEYDCGACGQTFWETR